jgi:hypothetical protein
MVAPLARKTQLIKYNPKMIFLILLFIIFISSPMERKITHILFCILMCVSSDVFSQVTDDFSDGNFSTAPAWQGNDTDFAVNGNQQLQLSSSGTSASFLSLTNTQPLDSCEWNFWIRLNFSPSSGNYARVYLASDAADLSGSLHGYYLQFGETGSGDQVELFKRSGSSSSSVCRGTTLIADPFAIRVKVTRDHSGDWQLFIDPAGGTNYILEAGGTDNSYTSTSFFGICCKYTTANASGFFFDDFYIYSPPDLTPAFIDSANIVSQDQVDVYFSEALSTVSAQTNANYSVNNGIGFAQTAVIDSADRSLVHLYFQNYFSSGQDYLITITGVQDLSGNTTINASIPFSFFVPQENDIVINEVLFDPYSNGVEWVEIYNRSYREIDLKGVSLCSQNNDGTLKEINPMAPYGYRMPSRSYLVLSTDEQAVKEQYNTTNPGGFLDMHTLPSLNNDSDWVVLINSSQTVIDKLHYRAEWHLPLLNDTKGISLERINYDNFTNDNNNWHSASESAGGATPAYKNSQYTDGEGGNEITLSPEVFSPDNDGYNDVLALSYSFVTPGMIGNVRIYDSRGRLERTLVRNELLATSGTFFWDGITDEKLKARIGIYIIYFETFDTKGEVKKYRKTCVVGGKF